MQTCVNLSLEKMGSDHNDRIYTLEEILNNHQISIILGASGSGKTTLLENYEVNNQALVDCFTVQEFLDFNPKIKNTAQILLLDALDEYKSSEVSKNFICSKLAYQIDLILQSNPSLKIVVACRQMEWNDAVDLQSLKKRINKEISIFNLLPLNDEQQRQMAEILNLSDIDGFLDKFQDQGFLNNVQMFVMLVKIYKSQNNEEILIKKDLYERFILDSKEKNHHHKHHEILEKDEIFKLIGYLAFYSIFAGVQTFSEDNIDKIVSAREGYSKEKLLKILDFKVFNDKKFIHRSIAEFALAYFIKNFFYQSLTNKERIYHLFIKNDQVIMHLKGVFAWLCALTQDEKLIVKDPFYQAIYADNSFFSASLKRKVLEEVFNYAKNNPYFLNFSGFISLKGFYSSGLDEFLIEIYKKALSAENHSIYFINAIFEKDKLSAKMLDFLKEVLRDKNIKSDYKIELIDVFEKDASFLLNLLEEIIDFQIEDKEDTLKDRILTLLYPNIISPDDIFKYLKKYQADVFGHCRYLFKTRYENKFKLVDKLHQLNFNKDLEKTEFANYDIKLFIKNYFAETLLKYEEGLSAREIFDFIEHFRAYYSQHDTLNFNCSQICEVKKLQKLANELYAIYIDEAIKHSKDDYGLQESIFNYVHFINFEEPDTRFMDEVLRAKLNEKISKEMKAVIFRRLVHLHTNERDGQIIADENIQKLAQQFHFKKALQEIIKNTQEKIKNFQKNELQRMQAITAHKEKVRANLKDKSDEEILKDIKFLNEIAYKMLFVSKKEYFYDTDHLRLNSLIKKILFLPNIKQFFSLKTLAQNPSNRYFKKDNVLYVSLCFNEDYFCDLQDDALKKYLYIISLQKATFNPFLKTNFCKFLEDTEPKLVIQTLKDFICLMIEIHYTELKVFVKYIHKMHDIFDLKLLLKVFLINATNLFVYEFLMISFYDLNECIFDEIKSLDLELDTLNFIKALEFLKDEKEEIRLELETALQFYKIFKNPFNHSNEYFLKLKSKDKIKIINYIMHVLNAKNVQEGSKEFIFYGIKEDCVAFLRDEVLKMLSQEELLALKTQQKHGFWHKRILHQLFLLDQAKDTADPSQSEISIENLKNFILKGDILSQKDFFVELCLRLERLASIIKDNRNNDKKLFYESGKPKDENDIRDIILVRLKDIYSDLDIMKEKYEGANRVDMNVKFKDNLSFEVQIECKKDNNLDIINALKTQLIDKYFSSEAKYGIYLIFNFSKTLKKDEMLNQFKALIPDECIDNIKVVFMDMFL